MPNEDEISTDVALIVRLCRRDPATGRLTQRMSVPIHAANLQGPNIVIDTVPQDEELEVYWSQDGDDPVPRPAFPAVFDKTTISADDTDAATLSNVPEGAVLVIDGEEHTITGGKLTITSPMPATYRFSFTGWPYLDWEATLEAVA